MYYCLGGKEMFKKSSVSNNESKDFESWVSVVEVKL